MSIIVSNTEKSIFFTVAELTERGLAIWTKRLGFHPDLIVTRKDIFIKRCIILMFMWNPEVEISSETKMRLTIALGDKFEYLVGLHRKEKGKDWLI